MRNELTYDASAIVVIIVGLDGSVVGTGCIRQALLLTQDCVKSLAKREGVVGQVITHWLVDESA